MFNIETFYEKLEKDRVYSFGEIIRDHEDFVKYVLRSLDMMIKCKADSNNFTIKVSEDLPQNKLFIYSLMSDAQLQDEYKQIIPENGFDYTADLKRTSQKKVTVICDVIIPTYNFKVKVAVELLQAEYSMSNIKTIKFVDAYFYNGNQILGEQLIPANLISNGEGMKNRNSRYADIKAMCLHQIKEKDSKLAA